MPLPAPSVIFGPAMPPAARAMLPVDPDARGEAFEQALAAQLTMIRPAGEEWAIAIDPADVMFCRTKEDALVQLGAGAYGQVCARPARRSRF
jgi:hypothetical protein